jgi:AcrR family transcriptional regulator
MGMNTAVERPVESGPAKRRQILAGARKAFAELGYERTTVDQIAASAGVSKATVYNHFEDKKAVFVACFSEEADEMRASLRASLGDPASAAGDLQRALQETGEKLMAVALAPAVICLYRHTIAEVGRFPEVGETLFERGPRQIHEMIAAYLKRWADLGSLRIEDPAAAAVQFFLLCQGDLATRALLGVLERPAEASIRATVKRGVRTFLRAYGA